MTKITAPGEIRACHPLFDQSPRTANHRPNSRPGSDAREAGGTRHNRDACGRKATHAKWKRGGEVCGHVSYPGFGSAVCYADGTFQRSREYDTFDSLIEEFDCRVRSDHDRYYGGECFEAIPTEDHDTADWEYVLAGDVPIGGAGRSMGGGFSGWRRRGRCLTVRARDGPGQRCV